MIDCTKLDDLLFDASPLAMETAARHAAECSGCAEKLASWNELTATAQSMRTTWQNDMLWPRIARALENERRQSAPPRRARWIGKAAAAVLLTVSLGGTIFYAVRMESREADFDQHILRVNALDQVERAEAAHIAAIRQLERVAEPKLDAAETPLMISYKEKLMLLDDAIAECEANIDRNRQNAHLRNQLLAIYTEKQQTLQDVLREDHNVSTP